MHAFCPSVAMNNFHLYEEIGHGKHSTVYKGRRKFSIEYLAVKSVDKSKRSRVMNEVAVSDDLYSSQKIVSCEHICRAYQWHETRNHLWVISDYCAGGDLLRVLKQDERIFSENQIYLFIYEIVSGLICMHANGIVFADMKPGNILFTESGSIKLSGFSVSQKIEDLEKILSDPTKQAPRRGSPYYMAPELFVENGFHSFASDLYALGCVLFEMISGKTPFGHVTSFAELQRAVIRTNPPEDVLECSPELVDLVRNLLEKKPRNRLTWRGLLDHDWVNKRGRQTGKAIPSEWVHIMKERIEPIETRFADKYSFSYQQPSPRSTRHRSYSIDSSAGCGNTTPTTDSARRYTSVTIRE